MVYFVKIALKYFKFMSVNTLNGKVDYMMRFLLIFVILIVSNIEANWICQNQYDPIEDSNLNICQTNSLQKDNTNATEQLVLRSTRNNLEIFLILGINTQHINEIEVKFDKKPKKTYHVNPSSDMSSIFINSDVINFGKNILENNLVYVRYLSDNNFLNTIQFDIRNFESKTSSQLVKNIIQLDNEEKELVKQMQELHQMLIHQNENKSENNITSIKDLSTKGVIRSKSPGTGQGMRLEGGKFVQP